MLHKILEYERNWVKSHEKDGISIGIPFEHPDAIKLKFAYLDDGTKKELNSLWESFDF